MVWMRRVRQKIGPKETDSAEEGTLVRDGFTLGRMGYFSKHLKTKYQQFCHLLTRLASSTLETAPTCSPACNDSCFWIFLKVSKLLN